ncbi:gamma-aminobutyric acid receptor subunit beta [Sarotherodon galilaeus]
MAKILLENYCFPENLVGMQEAIQQAINSGEILQISDRKTLATVLTAGVQGALNDPRLTISYEPNFVPVMPPTLSSLPKEQLIRLVKNSVKSDILENNVGYLRIDRIVGEETAVKFGSQLMGSIWDKIAHTSSLIFDLRYSTAGELSGVPFIISYFSDPESLIHIDTVYDRPSNSTKELWTIPSIVGERYGKKKDVIILTSRRTTGAAEAVAYALKKLRRAITVGERSAGGSVKVQKIRIAQSKFYITVPVARSVSPITGQSWEVTGVSPNVHVIAKEAVAKAKSLLAIRNSIPKVVQSISDKINRFYTFTERVPALLQLLESTDFVSVVSEEDLAIRLNQVLQTVSEDPRLTIKYMPEYAANVEEGPEHDSVPDDPGLLMEYIDTLLKVEILPGNTGYVRFDKFVKSSAKLEEAMAKKAELAKKMAKTLVLVASLLILGNVFFSHASFPPSVIVDIATIILNNYCSPEKLVGMKEAIEAASSNTGILNMPDAETLANVLSSGVQHTVSDPRLKVSYEPNYVPAVPPKLPPLPPEQLIAVIQNSMKLDILEGNIGYLRIDHILGEEAAEKVGPLLLDLVWSKILPTSALIFDLRYTGSGEVTGIPYIVSYFTEAEPLIHIDSIYDRPSNTTTPFFTMPDLLGQRYGATKSIIVLTSKNTKGIAEDVAYCLQNLKRATIVGEKTAGGSVKIDKFKVGDSDFYVTVPTAKSINPITGSTWEITGVTPDVEVNAEDALATAIKIINLRAQVPAIIEGSATLIADNYAFENIGADVAAKLKEQLASGTYNMVVSKQSLESKLSADLQTLSGDKSLKTTSNTPALPPMDYTPEMYIELIKVSFHTDVFENNIGYLRFDMFGDFEEVKPIAQVIVEHVWNKVLNTDALIVDLRNNLGGPTTAIAGFCSYFFDADKQIVLDKLYDRSSGTITELQTLPELTGVRYGSKKSVIILTSGATAGAAEEFVYIMKKLGRAMIVGETTAGASHPPKTFQVGETDIFLSIPTVHSDNSAGPAWEGAGIAPHIPVPADAALDTAKGIFNKHLAVKETTS